MSEIALFESALRAAVPVRPDPEIGADLVPRLARTARESQLDASATRVAAAGSAPRRRPRSRFALVARVGIAALMIPLLLAALAVAGVTVPQPARSAFESVGVTLPNQPSDNPANNQGNATQQPSDQSPASDRASEQGKQASAAKGANGKHLAKGKNKNANGSNPGRRVQRHGTGAIPGPASPPPGHAYGPSSSAGSSHGNAGSQGSSSRGKSGVAHTQGALHGRGH